MFDYYIGIYDGPDAIKLKPSKIECKGNSTSAPTTDTSSRVVTETTTSVGDIGLTGSDAVNALKNLTNAQVKNTTESGKQYSRLLGTTEVINRDALSSNTQVSGQAISAVENIGARGFNLVDKVISGFTDITKGAQQTAVKAIGTSESTIRSGQAIEKTGGQLLAENAPFVIAGIAAIYAIIKVSK